MCGKCKVHLTGERPQKRHSQVKESPGKTKTWTRVQPESKRQTETDKERDRGRRSERESGIARQGDRARERQAERGPEMAKLVTYIFIVSSLVLWYLLLFGSTLSGVEATNGHGSQLEGRDFHHHGGSHHIRRK